MDPSSIIAQVDKDTTPVASAKMGSNNGSASESARKGNMKRQLAILRDRLFCCVRANVPPPAEHSPGYKSQNKRVQQIYNPPAKGGNVSVLRRNNYRADNGASVTDHSESASNGRSDMPLLAGENGGDFVTCESIVLSESRDDGSNNNNNSKMQQQPLQGRGVLYEVHLSTAISSASSSSGRHSSPIQVATPLSNGEISNFENVRNRPSSSFVPGATTGPPTSSTPLGTPAASNSGSSGNGAKTPQLFSPSPISGVIPSAPGRRGGNQQSEVAVTINNSAGQTSPSATSSTGAVSMSFPLLLGAPLPEDRHRPCLIIDLDETLVHSSFKPIPNADFIVPVEIDGTIYQVYVQKRPHVDEFLQRVGRLFECVLFTASLAKYADPVADLLDKWGVFRARLFREACVFYRGNYVKDLGQLGRELDSVAIIDNSPASYLLHPENAIPVTSWFDDPSDTQLVDLLPILERLAASLAPAVRQVGTRELLRDLIGPVPQVAPLAAPTTPNSLHSGNSVVTSATNPNTQHQQDSGMVSTSATVTLNSSVNSSGVASPPSSPFSPQPVQLVVVGPTVHTTSTIHHISPSPTSSNNRIRTARFNMH